MSHKASAQDDDLDDLDDIVEQFDTRSTNESQPSEATSSKSPLPSSSSSSSKPRPESSVAGSISNSEVPLGKLPDDLAKQLAEGMESLMRDLAESGHGPFSEEDRKRKDAWERMLIDGMDGMVMNEQLERNLGEKSKDTSEASAKTSVDDFQASILQAMEKLKDSDSTLHTDASSAAAASDDPLEAILNQLSSGLNESGEDNGDLQEMLETMMQQLMSKEVLYEPLKELNDKFPAYLSENDQNLSSADKERFNNQMIRVSAIVRIFEDPSYKENDQEKGAQIVSLMNEMQSFGSPPTEIMGSLPPGFDVGLDGAPKLPESCAIM